MATMLIVCAAAAIPAAAKPADEQQPPAEAASDNGFCDTYGTGYHRVPGTDTCVKISGYVQMTVGISGR